MTESNLLVMGKDYLVVVCLNSFVFNFKYIKEFGSASYLLQIVGFSFTQTNFLPSSQHLPHHPTPLTPQPQPQPPTPDPRPTHIFGNNIYLFLVINMSQYLLYLSQSISDYVGFRSRPRKIIENICKQFKIKIEVNLY